MNSNLPLIVLPLYLLILGCDGGTDVYGTVMDDRGKPLSDVTVRLEIPNDKLSKPDVTNSDTKGKFHIKYTHPPGSPAMKLTAEMDGYQQFQKDFVAEQRVYRDWSIVLEKKVEQ